MRTFIFFLLLFSSSFVLAETAEQATSNYFNSIQNNPKKLSDFLYNMPKGADLHNHLGGVSMAENMLRYAKQDNLCVNSQSLAVIENHHCPSAFQVDKIQRYPQLYNQVIDA